MFRSRTRDFRRTSVPTPVRPKMSTFVFYYAGDFYSVVAPNVAAARDAFRDMTGAQAAREAMLTSVSAHVTHPVEKDARPICDCAPDCQERIECEQVGDIGHYRCGWCGEHDQARHICLCPIPSGQGD